jgi:hypothetical protein
LQTLYTIIFFAPVTDLSFLCLEENLDPRGLLS